MSTAAVTPSKPKVYRPRKFACMPRAEVHALHAAKQEGREDIIAAWWQEERRKLSDLTLVCMPEARDYEGNPITEPCIPAGLLYYFDHYASVEDNRGREIPVTLWEVQREFLWALWSRESVWAKSRRFGVTWMWRNYVVWLLAFAEGYEGAGWLFLSKDEDGAKSNIPACRRIINRMPEPIRPVIGTETVGKLTLADRLSGEREAYITSATVSSRTARGEGLVGVMADEEAHYQMRLAKKVYSAVHPTLFPDVDPVTGEANGPAGQYAHVSTATCPPTVDGDGQFFAQKVDGVASGDSKIALVFMPASRRPGYTPEYLAGQLAGMGPEEFRNEYPETLADILMPMVEGQIIPTSVLEACVDRGRELDKLLAAGNPRVQPHDGYGVICMDFGEFSAYVLAWDMGDRNHYLVDEDYHEAEAITAYVPEQVSKFRRHVKRFRKAPYDSAGIQSFRVWRDELLSKMGISVKPRPVSFKTYKRQTIEYYKHCADNTASIMNNVGFDAMGGTSDTIAISPRCEQYLRQMYGWHTKKGGDGMPVKVDDHGPDASLAYMASPSDEWRKSMRRKSRRTNQAQLDALQAAADLAELERIRATDVTRQKTAA